MSAIARWRRLVHARLAETERLSGNALDAGFWNRRAARFAARTAATAADDPFLAVVRRHVGSRTTVLDVGSGNGRFALPLTTDAAEVVAVDPSSVMLSLLEQTAARRHIRNIRTVESRFEDTRGLRGDIVLCSYVLPLIVDVETFAQKLSDVAGRRVLVYLNAVGADTALDPLWRYFHGAPRSPAPTYLDACDLLAELGIHARVQVVRRRASGSFASLAEAVDDFRQNLLLPDEPALTRRLTTVLETWLIRRNGVLWPPLDSIPAAIIDWKPERDR